MKFARRTFLRGLVAAIALPRLPAPVARTPFKIVAHPLCPDGVAYAIGKWTILARLEIGSVYG